MLKTYAVLVAIFSWLLAPALFNPTFVLSDATPSALAKQKLAELKRVFAWYHALLCALFLFC